MISDIQKSTVVIGASPDPERYSYKATVALLNKGVEVFPIGIRKGFILEKEIILGRPALMDVHTITLYVGPERLKDWIAYIIQLKPKRIIFNPGTFDKEANNVFLNEGIECIEACTLVMLSLNQY